MARISKQSAAEITRKLVEKIQKEIDAKELELKEYVTEVYVATIPKDVMRMWSRGKQWMNNTRYLYLRGTGLTGSKWTYYYITEHYPSCANTPEVELTDEQANAVVKIENAISDLKEKKKRTTLEIEGTLLGLGTYKRILEQMPYLAPYLPVQERNQGLMHIPSVTKEKIQCLISTTDDKCLKQL